MRKHKVSFGDMGLYNSDISDEMNVCLDESWKQKYGLEITDVAINDINLTVLDVVDKIHFYITNDPIDLKNIRTLLNIFDNLTIL